MKLHACCPCDLTLEFSQRIKAIFSIRYEVIALSNDTKDRSRKGSIGKELGQKHRLSKATHEDAIEGPPQHGPEDEVTHLGTSSSYVMATRCSHILSGPRVITSIVTEKMQEERGPRFIIAQ